MNCHNLAGTFWIKVSRGRQMLHPKAQRCPGTPSGYMLMIVKKISGRDYTPAKKSVALPGGAGRTCVRLLGPHQVPWTGCLEQ